MDKQDLWNAWQNYSARINEMFINNADLVHIRDMLSCSCMCGDEPVEGAQTDDSGLMWHWLMELPGFHSDFKGVDDVKRNIGEGTGPFSEAIMRVQILNAESWNDDAVRWTQKAYDMYAEHWKW